jgi:hypothetical protein
MDEYGDMQPGVWRRVIRPQLADREGWATFIGTPKGKNGFWRLWRTPGRSDWMRLGLKASETGILSHKELADVARCWTTTNMPRSSSAASRRRARRLLGPRRSRARGGGQITTCRTIRPEVYAAWDLGMADSTVIWLFQPHVAGEIRVIDVIKGEGVGLDWYVRELERARERHGIAIVAVGRPHIAARRRGARARHRQEPDRDAERALASATICPSLPVEDGIQAVRMMLPRCWFDRTRARRGSRRCACTGATMTSAGGYRVSRCTTGRATMRMRSGYFAVGYRPPHPSAYRGSSTIRGGWLEVVGWVSGSGRKRPVRFPARTPKSGRGGGEAMNVRNGSQADVWPQTAYPK